MNFPTWPAHIRPDDKPRVRSERGAVLPSPVVLLSIVAVALAALAFVTTRGGDTDERDVSATKAAATQSETQSETQSPEADKPKPKPKPTPVQRGDQGVVVFNNAGITGLAARVSESVKKAGWPVVAADNWYGTVAATTVYYPQGKKREGRQLALDLGIARILPADVDSDMSTTNLTLILTGEL
ncbi:MAG: LytR C-terminal domain-containing protein [Nocardioidaceae bacterium]|nr:LytR C-terminal domain-containing protein [Nocardioidaceae bacterium]